VQNKNKIKNYKHFEALRHICLHKLLEKKSITEVKLICGLLEFYFIFHYVDIILLKDLVNKIYIEEYENVIIHFLNEYQLRHDL